MKLRESLAEWDGKSVEQIEAIYSRFVDDDSFFPNIVKLLGFDAFQIGASWLIKRHLEGGNPLSADSITAVYRQTLSLSFWESKLHILQCIPYLPIPIYEKETAEAFLRRCIADKNKFVRAWAYSGFYELADQFPEYREEARQFLEIVFSEESASVKARIRNSIKKGFYRKGE